MKKYQLIFTSILLTFGANSFAQGCSNPAQKVPTLDNYWELKIAQGFNDLNVIKKLDNTYCFNYHVNKIGYSNPLFQMFSKEQADFFIQKIPTFKDYKTPDTGDDLLLYALGMPYMNHDYPNDDLKDYLLSRYSRYVPEANLTYFDTKHHNFWINPELLKKNPQRLKHFIDYANSLLPLYNKQDLIRKDDQGNNALHYAVMTKNSKPLEHFKPTGLETLKKNNLGANLWHYAFFPAPEYLPKAYVQQELKNINKYLIDNFKPSYIRFMSLGNPLNQEYNQVYPFEVFLHHYKDNNPELYNFFKTKYPQLFVLSEEEIEALNFNKKEVEKYFASKILDENKKKKEQTKVN